MVNIQHIIACVSVYKISFNIYVWYFREKEEEEMAEKTGQIQFQNDSLEKGKTRAEQ